jgi:hypothetical protein
MSSLNFPTNPAIGDIYTIGNNSWQWTGSAWIRYESLNKIFDTVQITSSTQAISTVTGALVVTGGVGIGGDLYVGGTFYAGGEAVLTTSSFAYNISEGNDIQITLSPTSGALTFSNVSTLQSVTGRGSTTSNRITISNTTQSTGTTSGALIVTGGVGIGNNLIVQNNISGGTLTGKNLIQGRIVFVGTNSQLTDSGSLTYDDLINLTAGGAGSSSTATNLLGGGPGTIPYQQSNGITRFVSTGTAGFILSSNGTSAPTWIPYTPTSNTSTNLAGGTAGSIPYQLSSNTTTFLSLSGTEGAVLAAGINSPKYVSQVKVTDGTSSTTSSTVQSLQVTSGGIGILGDSYFSDSIGIGTNVTIYGDSTANTASGALYVLGGAGIKKNLYVGGNVVIDDITDSNNSAQGSIVTAGGVGIAKDIVIGGDITVGLISNATVVPAIYSNNFLLSSYTSPIISTTSTINLDQYSQTAYRTAKYTIQIIDGGDVHAAEMMLTHNNTHVYKNEYGIVTSSGELGNFSATANGTEITLKFTPFAPTSMVIKLVRISISI